MTSEPRSRLKPHHTHNPILIKLASERRQCRSIVSVRCSKSCVCEEQALTPAGSNCHATGKKDNASTDEEPPSGMQRQKKHRQLLTVP